MDKTGTLTKGVFQVEKVETRGTLSAEELLKYAAYAEANSNHPISVSLREGLCITCSGSRRAEPAKPGRERKPESKARGRHSMGE